MPIPHADPDRSDSADSMRDQADSPTYTQRFLGRKAVHPPYSVNWANVSAANQNLDFLNSRAMQGIDRSNTMADPRQSGHDGLKEEKWAADMRLTPDNSAKKQEKAGQEFLQTANGDGKPKQNSFWDLD